MKQNSALQVMYKLKDDIVRGQYAPGQKLVMAGLKQRYGVGVGPLREALSLLIGEGMVDVRDQRGYRVSCISIVDMCDIYETRACVERLCIDLSIVNSDDDWEGRVLGQAHNLFKLKDLSDRLGHVDLDEWDRRHDLFHSALVSNAGLQHLLHLRQTLRDKALRYKRIWLRENVNRDYLFKENFNDHQELVDLALKRDKRGAKQLIYDHLMVPVAVIRQSLP